MLEHLIQIDTQVFYWINHHCCSALDWLMWGASQGYTWVIVLLAVLFICFDIRKYRKQWWWALVGIALCILLADRISVLCFKEVFCRLRPCHALSDVNMFHTSCGGKYGFVSSHAANLFAIVMFLILHKKSSPQPQGKHPWLMGGLLVAWAVLVGYSRVYLGKHYPGDVICGALLGLLIGCIVWWLIDKLPAKIQKRKN